MITPRGGHPAQVIGKRGPAFECSDGSSNPPEHRVDWSPFITDDGEEQGWVGPKGEWRPDKPPAVDLQPRNDQGQFTR